MNASRSLDFERVLGLLPTMTCVLTSAYEQRRGGVIVRRAMQCADEPVCIAVAVPTGHRIATLIRDSHTFALCLLDRSNRLLIRKFDTREDGDPFDTIETLRLVSTSPIPARAMAAIDCEVVRHYDLEADHEVYVGQVLAVRALNVVLEHVTPESVLNGQHTGGANGQNGHAMKPATPPSVGEAAPGVITRAAG